MKNVRLLSALRRCAYAAVLGVALSVRQDAHASCINNSADTRLQTYCLVEESKGKLMLRETLEALDARIRLQRAVAAANRIPASRRVIDAMVNHAPRGTRDALTSVRAGVRTALGAVLGLLGAAQSQQGQLAPASGGPNPPPARTSAVSSAAVSPVV